MADQETKHIPKKKVGESLYEQFYLQGMETLQRLSGKVWTDFNEHDPGVTILENIAYTLTELAEKTKLPVSDLLIENEGQVLQSGDNGMFIPSEIFTINPVTVTDLRKVIIDQIDDVKNVWIELVNMDGSPLNNNLKGLYKIAVELYFYDEQKIQPDIMEQVRSVFHAHRNLCEDIYEISICKPYSLGLKFNISLEDNIDGEDMLAQILYKLTNYLTPEVQFSSLEQLLADGMTTDQIFDGPHLENGFIQDVSLNDPITSVTMSELVRLISQIDGIKSINQFDLEHLGDPDAANQLSLADLQLPQDKVIVIPGGYVPVLVFPTSAKKLTYRNNSTVFYPNLKIVKTKFASLQAGDYKNFQLASNARNEIEIPQGSYRNVPDYYLMRNQFPAIYGAGEFRLPSGLPTARYAQVKQLQAYLLSMDQVLANFLAQLNHLYALYDVSSSELQSYYTQQLEGMEDILDLLREDPNDNDQYVLNNWKEVLTQTNALFDHPKIKRLDNIADNLVARFSEKFPSYTLQKINAVTHESTVSYREFEKRLLLWKRKFVRYYDKLSYNRFRSYNYSLPTEYLSYESGKEEGQSNMPGLIAKICILLGIQNGAPRSLTKVIWDSGIIIYKRRAGQEIISWKLENIFQKDAPDALEFENTVIINDTVTDLHDGYYFIGNKNDILQEVLKYGIKESSYEIKHTTLPTRNQFYILFTDDQRSNVVHISDSLEAANNSQAELIHFFNEVNDSSEGIVLMEHLLLSPPYNGHHFGFSIDFSVLDPKIDSTLVSHHHQPMEKRNRDVQILLENLLPGPVNNSCLLRIVHADGGYKVEVRQETQAITAISEKTYALYSDAENLLNRLQNLKRSQADTTAVQPVFNVSYGHSAPVDETFFSFRMSAIMPNWPVRFQDPNFRQNFENILYRESPVHLVSNSYWLDLMTYSAFEAKYFQWISLQSNRNAGPELLHAAHELVLFLQEQSANSTGND